MPWYGVRSVLEWEKGVYEERVIVVRADDFDGALRACEELNAEYTAAIDAKDLGLYQAYWIPDDELDEARPPRHGVEVFSLVRGSDLKPQAYLDAFFDTGHEYQRAVN